MVLHPGEVATLDFYAKNLKKQNPKVNNNKLSRKNIIKNSNSSKNSSKKANTNNSQKFLTIKRINL